MGSDLLNELNSPEIEVRVNAIEKLARQPSEARKELALILLDPTSGTRARIWAMIALYSIGCDPGDGAEQALIRCVDDPVGVVRRNAIHTLGHLRVETAVSRIAAHLADHAPVEASLRDDSSPSEAARRALKEIGSAEALALLTASLSEAKERDAATASDGWYYCDAETDDERCEGPVSFEQLVQLIRTGEIPYDAPVSVDRTEWLEADTIEEILRAIPLDRERIVLEFIEYGEADEPEWGWASDRMYSVLESVPELAWELIVELIERAPSDKSLGFFAASPLEDLLSKDGAQFIERVEKRAESNPKFRRAVGMLRRLGMTDDVWFRVCKLAQLSNE